MENLGEKMEKEEIECLINEIDIDGELQMIKCNTYCNSNTVDSKVMVRSIMRSFTR